MRRLSILVSLLSLFVSACNQSQPVPVSLPEPPSKGTVSDPQAAPREPVAIGAAEFVPSGGPHSIEGAEPDPVAIS